MSLLIHVLEESGAWETKKQTKKSWIIILKMLCT